ncbi:MAG: hypothetical protein RE471_09760 [Ferroplasma sp.]|jgi:hypothetical protein|uniref:hypothetical protein n=1 Tax=Ferroplasma sp. TaxID=2591003 RepID=UPI002814D5A9|nr:hypothetical protein [Ferroplasma sp.]WMT51249.1 MAG: hypothetical protein RE471_09760 [Ferroplasma sp.]
MDNSISKSKRIWQYWSEHIELSGLLVGIWILFVSLSQQELKELPRSVIPFLVTILATLLGLTFTAFSILVAITPSIRKDFVRTVTFDNIGKTFYITLIIQFLTLILSLMDYIFFSTDLYYYILLASTFGTFFSLGFLLYLVRDIFGLFRVVRGMVSRRQ